jgi:16S rRNA (adenine1518-N6/adenine1519-N6)-dimethyltransferase
MLPAKKQFGQNFLSDPAILASIADFAGVEQGDHIVEIGPGRGDLTAALLERGASVHAVELDRDLFPVLEARFAGNDQFSLTEGDILDTPLAVIAAAGEYSVVANIPYYITAPIIRKLLSDTPAPKKITLLVQKEVAERLAGGAKHRSLLTLAAQYYAACTLGPVIGKTHFDPVPKVDSQLVQLVPYRAYDADKDKAIFRIMKIGFAARRKTLLNNCVAGQLGTKEELQTLWQEFGWSEARRPQELEIPDWERLFEKLS